MTRKLDIRLTIMTTLILAPAVMLAFMDLSGSTSEHVRLVFMGACIFGIFVGTFATCVIYCRLAFFAWFGTAGAVLSILSVLLQAKTIGESCAAPIAVIIGIVAAAFSCASR